MGVWGFNARKTICTQHKILIHYIDFNVIPSNYPDGHPGYGEEKLLLTPKKPRRK